MIHALFELPALLFLFALVPPFLLLRLASDKTPVLYRVCIVCGALSVVVFLVLSTLNLGRPGFLWHDEPSILSIAAAYVHGEPLYHARTAPALYSLLYGPSTFLAYVPLLKLSTDPMKSVRWLGLAVNLANLFLLGVILRRKTSWPVAFGLLPVAVAILLTSASHLLGVRGDAMLLLCFCIGLASGLRNRSLVAAVVCGMAAGLSLDFKVTVIPAACLLVLLVYRWSGWRAALICATSAAVTSAGLFFLPHISFRDYMDWLLLSSRQGLEPSLLSGNILAAVFIVAPGLLLRLCRVGPRRIYASRNTAVPLFALALVAAIVTGSKNGAGPWHLWPLLPFAMMWAAKETQHISSPPAGSSASLLMLASIAIAATLVVLRFGYRDFRSIYPRNIVGERANQQGAEAELRSLTRRNPGRNIAMGYGNDAADYRSSLRFELPLEGEDYFLDENALAELIKTGAAMPDSVTKRVLGCDDLWLIPRGEEPFQTRRSGDLPGGKAAYLFPAEIRLHFTETYTRQSEGSYYDLWGCTEAGAKGR